MFFVDGVPPVFLTYARFCPVKETGLIKTGYHPHSFLCYNKLTPKTAPDYAGV